MALVYSLTSLYQILSLVMPFFLLPVIAIMGDRLFCMSKERSLS